MNDDSKIKIIIASDIDYENLIAEIYCNDKFIALLQQEDSKDVIKVEFSPNIKIINLELLQNVLIEAKNKLLNEQ